MLTPILSIRIILRRALMLDVSFICWKALDYGPCAPAQRPIILEL